MLIPYLHRSFPKLGPMTEEHRALAAELRRDVEVLAGDIGPRGVFAIERYRLAERFLTAALERAGYAVTRREFEASGPAGPVPCANLEVTLAGSGGLARRILVVGAHYDSVPGCPAANDNASGVAGVLSIARRMKEAAQRRAGEADRGRCTIRFVLFANEEPPFFNLGEMGSQVYARECRAAGNDLIGMVCLETIGYYSNQRGSQHWPAAGLGLVLPTIGNFIALVGPTLARDWIQRAARLFEQTRQFGMLAAAAPEAIDQVNWSDHRGFNEVGYPAFMVTDTAPLRYPHYHLATDTPEKLDYESMARVVTGLIGIVDGLAADG